MISAPTPNPLKVQRDNLAKQIAAAKASGKEDIIKKLSPNYIAVKKKLESQEKVKASKAVADAGKNPKEASDIADELTGGEEKPNEANEERLNKIMTKNESTNIANFLKAISQKNYAQADKYLQGVVEGKLKASIDKAIQKSTIYAK
jgi:hypothetical protein